MTYRMHRKAYRNSPIPSMFDMMHGEEGSSHHNGRVFSETKKPDLKDPFKRPPGGNPPKNPPPKKTTIKEPDLKDPFNRSATRNPGLVYQQPRGVRPLPYPAPGLSYADQKRLKAMGYSIDNPNLAQLFKSHFNLVVKSNSGFGHRGLRVNNKWSMEDSNALSHAFDWARSMPRDWLHYVKKAANATSGSRGGKPTTPRPGLPQYPGPLTTPFRTPGIKGWAQDNLRSSSRARKTTATTKAPKRRRSRRARRSMFKR